MNDFWGVALIAWLIGFVIATLIIKRRRSEFEENLLTCVYGGKRVIVAVGNKAHIFKLEDGHVVVKQAKANFHEVETEDPGEDPPEQGV